MANEERGTGMETRNKAIKCRRTALKKPPIFHRSEGPLHSPDIF